jgi:putative tributyrin esterase
VNLATMQFLSPALRRHVTYTALLPEATWGPGPFPVLYQLHGATDDHSAWTRFSNLVRHVANEPLIVVMPDGGRGWWMNLGPRERYEDFVIDDLSRHVEATFHVRPGRQAIGGLSMGGFGAVYLGLRHPDRFASIWSHSGAFRTPERVRELGSPEDEPTAATIEAVVRSIELARMPVLGFDCGVDDALLEGNRRLDALLTELGLPHLYREHPGAHTWQYWDEHVVEALAQHARVLGLDAGVGVGGDGQP